MARHWGLHVAAGIILIGSAACSFAWSDYDPRDGDPNENASSSSTTSSSSSSSGGGGATSTSTSGGSTGEGGSSAGGNATTGSGGAGGSGGGGTPPTSFSDDFDRASGSTIGNGWIEKTPDAFGIFDNHVIRTDPGPGYRDNLVYRPVSESQLDVEVILEFEFISTTIEHPGIFARGDYDVIADANTFVGYELWVSNATAVKLGQGSGTSDSTTHRTITPSSALVTGERYRLRMRVKNTTEVDIDAWIEHWQNAGSWVSLGSTRFHDDTAARIDTPGAVGFNGETGTEYFVDNFEYFVP